MPGPPALHSDNLCLMFATIACSGLLCPAGGLTRGFLPRPFCKRGPHRELNLEGAFLQGRMRTTPALYGATSGGCIENGSLESEEQARKR